MKFDILKKSILVALICLIPLQDTKVEATPERYTANTNESYNTQVVKDDAQANTTENIRENSKEAAKNEITNIRYSKSADKIRVVFDLNEQTQYDITEQSNGDILIDFSQPINAAYLNGIDVDDDTVSHIEAYSDKNMSCAIIKLKDTAAFTSGLLENPRRLYIDIDKNYAYSVTKNLEQGLTQISYYSKQNGTRQFAQLVEVDPKYFKFAPVLGGGNVMAKNTVRAMANYANAAVAENASYFGAGKELYGVTKIADDLVSSMYLTRTAFGILKDGTPYIGDVSYTGIVHSDNGDLYVSGLNGTRSNNSVMLYNRYYGKSTGTNNSGIEYVVKNNKIIAINNGNSPLRNDEIVVSVTGDSNKNILAGLRVGDTLEVEQILNEPWDTATDILGVGPRLVKDGQVDITSAQEQIGVDVTGARAPRTAVGILRNGNVLFAVLDGRQSHSRGMMLDEFARFLIGMDVVDAVNFDGGGSSEMVINGKIVNIPSDGMERPVATALVAVRR